MEKFIKRIQSRLTYNGIKVTKIECREAYQQFIPEESWNNPSDEQIALVVQRITEWSESSEIESVEAESMDLAIQQPEEPEAEEENAIAPLDQESEESAIAKTDSTSLTVEQSPGSLGQADFSKSMSQALYKLGVANDAESRQLLSSLFNELTSEALLKE